ncbi:MAG: GC-type dockerin domain-anchored protein, partial [Phycisphaerales bacterium]|nr:GC-type dockerin domain-anchored protein [Phycisphaerales bacterium]
QGVVVQRYNGSSWVYVTSKFDVTTASRDVRTKLHCEVTFDRGLYRIIRTVDAGASPPTALVCSSVTGTPIVAQFAHYFKFGPELNPADLGSTGGVAPGDGTLDNNDYVVFIDYFYAQNTKADLGVTGGIHGEDGVFDNNDFIAFNDWLLGAYNPNQNSAACPSGFSGGNEGGSQFSMMSGEDQFTRELNALWQVYSSLPLEHPRRPDVAARIAALFDGR